MKTIREIAKFELGTLFYSPVAWLVIIVFTVIAALAYTNTLDTAVFLFTRGSVPYFGHTYEMFNEANRSFMIKVFAKIHLFVPLLTMGLISKEISSGSIKLMLSSPVTPLQLVLGKFFAVLCFNLIFCGLLLLLVIAGSFSIASMDVGLALTAVFAFFLLTMAYTALGLFISSLTSYQIIAAIGTFALIFALEGISSVGQGIPIIESITYWLSLSGRAIKMMVGLITLENSIYFLVITVMFLSFTVIKVAAGRKSSSLWVQTKPYLLMFGVVVLVSYLSTQPFLNIWWDTSNVKKNSLTDTSKEILKEIDDEVTMSTYVNILDDKSFFLSPKWRLIDLSKFDTYKRYLPKQFKEDHEYVHYYAPMEFKPGYLLKQHATLPLDSIAEKGKPLDMDFEDLLGPEDIKQKIDLTDEGHHIVRVLRYKDKEVYLRMFDDAIFHPTEKEISTALARLLGASKKVIFTSGNEEASIKVAPDHGYQFLFNDKLHRHSLINNGIISSEIDLETQELPKDTDVLVIADPKTRFSTKELEAITNYINKGGNAMILVNPKNREIVKPILAPLGVYFKEGTLQQDNKDLFATDILANVTADNPILSSADAYVTMPTAMAIAQDSISDFSVHNLLMVDKVNTQIRIDSTQIKPITAPVAITLSKPLGNGNDQRLLIAGDSDLFTNKEGIRRGIGDNIITMNKDFSNQVFRWFTNGEFPLAIERNFPKDDTIIGSKTARRITEIFLVYILPALIFMLGAFVLARRRRH